MLISHVSQLHSAAIRCLIISNSHWEFFGHDSVQQQLHHWMKAQCALEMWNSVSLFSRASNQRSCRCATCAAAYKRKMTNACHFLFCSLPHQNHVQTVFPHLHILHFFVPLLHGISLLWNPEVEKRRSQRGEGGKNTFDVPLQIFKAGCFCNWPWSN